MFFSAFFFQKHWSIGKITNKILLDTCRLLVYSIPRYPQAEPAPLETIGLGENNVKEENASITDQSQCVLEK